MDCGGVLQEVFEKHGYGGLKGPLHHNSAMEENSSLEDIKCCTRKI